MLVFTLEQYLSHDLTFTGSDNEIHVIKLYYVCIGNRIYMTKQVLYTIIKTLITAQGGEFFRQTYRVERESAEPEKAILKTSETTFEVLYPVSSAMDRYCLYDTQRIDIKENFLSIWKTMFSEIENVHDSISIDEKNIQEVVLFKGSTVLTDNKQRCYLLEGLKDVGRENITPTLLYRASENEFNARAFYNKCKDRGPTVTLILTTNGTVIGGYLDEDWTRSATGSGWIERSHSQSFLFNLNSFKKYNVLRNAVRLAYFTDCLGPSFGGSSGDSIADLQIRRNENHGTAFNYGVSHSPVSFDVPSNTDLAGTNRFDIVDYEVWKV